MKLKLIKMPDGTFRVVNEDGEHLDLISPEHAWRPGGKHYSDSVGTRAMCFRAVKMLRHITQANKLANLNKEEAKRCIEK
jgi:hypothetical protein